MLTKSDLENIKVVVKTEIESAIIDNNDRLFKVLATKEDVGKEIVENNHRLFKVLATKEDVARIYVSQEQHREDINEVQKSVDNLYGVVKRNDEEQTVLAHTVLGHTKSISKIEKTLSAGRRNVFYPA